MKALLDTTLILGIILFSYAEAFFWTSAELTHLNSCSQKWVDSAPTASDRQERAQIRVRHIDEVAELRNPRNHL